jgi:hypothetical protein
MTKTLAQIESRLAEITAEQAELAKVDYDALLAEAIVSGADVDQVEDDQEQASRRAKRLRIEHATLTGMIPEAKRIEAMPAVEALKKAHAKKMAESAKVVSDALLHWEGLQADITRLQGLRSEASGLTLQACALCKEVQTANPGFEMGMPLSRQLGQAGERMGYLGREMAMWATMPVRDGGNTFGQDVDPAAAVAA